MYSVKVEGFQTKAQADAFIRWYSHQGESQSMIWFEDRKMEGKIDVDCMVVDCAETFPITFQGNEARMMLDIGGMK